MSVSGVVQVIQGGRVEGGKGGRGGEDRSGRLVSPRITHAPR